MWVRADNVKVDHSEMMLNTDLCLAYSGFDSSAGTYEHSGEEGTGNDGQLSAATDDCCAWFSTPFSCDLEKPCLTQGVLDSNDGLYCGVPYLKVPYKGAAAQCCRGDAHATSCKKTGSAHPRKITDLGGWAAETVLNFADNENTWLMEFQTAWYIATTVGGTASEPLKGSCDR